MDRATLALREGEATGLRDIAHQLSGMLAAFSTIAGAVASELEEAAARQDFEAARELLDRLRPMTDEIIRQVGTVSVEALMRTDVRASRPESRGTLTTCRALRSSELTMGGCACNVAVSCRDGTVAGGVALSARRTMMVARRSASASAAAKCAPAQMREVAQSNAAAPETWQESQQHVPARCLCQRWLRVLSHSVRSL